MIFKILIDAFIKIIVYKAAPTSSIITPQPPLNSSNFFNGYGFKTSKMRKIRNVIPQIINVFGRKTSDNNIPTTSSITIYLASLPQLFSKNDEKKIPTQKRIMEKIIK